jgi:hypothetical protein
MEDRLNGDFLDSGMEKRPHVDLILFDSSRFMNFIVQHFGTNESSGSIVTSHEQKGLGSALLQAKQMVIHTWESLMEKLQ